MSVWVVRLELYGFPQKFDKLIKSALHPADCRQVAIDDVIVCSCCDQLSIERFCLLQFPLTDQCDSLLLLGGVLRRTLGDLLLWRWCGD